ncbi:MAG: disulfide bond formation protein DsbA [Mesorhizobium amorphae]|nr:MAG: disulfide bond formation protein DsbA [Mesorhizobium amorphae]
MTFSRRSVLSTLALAPAAVWLSACSEAEGQTAQTGTAAPAAPAAVNLPESSGTVDMAKLLEPGALPDKVLGEANAPVTIVEYASMTCPHCAHFHETTLPTIKANYIDTGKARLILREFAFDPRAEAGFMLARCSNERYFPMVDVLFKQQQTWAGAQDARDALLQISRLAGFSQQSFEACLTDQALLDQIRGVKDRGAGEFGVDSTPTFFINGTMYKGALSVEQMSAVIDSLLAA